MRTITPVLWFLGAGCNGALSFTDDGGQTQVRVDAGMDVLPPPPDLGQPDIQVIGDAPVDPGVDMPVDVPPDNGPDLQPDRPPDVPSTPDVRPDVQPDVQPDIQPDIQPDFRPDLVPDTVINNGPVVCGNDTDCHFPTLALHCLLPGASCVECTGDAQCGGRRCDTNAGSQTFHRCVECMSADDCPTTTSEHPSTCNAEHQCLNGCSDDSAAQLICPKAAQGFACQTSGGTTPDHQCIDCLASANCAAPLRVCLHNVCVQCTVNADCTAAGATVCDQVSGRCVQCGDSTDCRTAGLRLCNPATHLCVASN